MLMAAVCVLMAVSVQLIAVVPPNELLVQLDSETVPVHVYSDNVLPLAEEELSDDLTSLVVVPVH